MTRVDRAGFTMIELLVVATVGGLLLMGIFGTFVTQQRGYTLRAAKVETQQTVRSGLDFMSGELRSLSTKGGDLMVMDDDTITIRSMRKIGIVCWVTSSPPAVRALNVGESFANQDSVFLFADNDLERGVDDEWLVLRAGTVDTTASCNGDPAQEIPFPSGTAAFAADSVSVGGMVRSFEWISYGLGSYGSKVYLGQWSGGSGFTPLIGPLDNSTGPAMRLDYYDWNGAVTTTPADVVRIDVMLRTASQARRSGGTQIADSLNATIYSRN
jgi:prepilin-type N-terminal cleavage/methylation domain-containing protein